MGHYADQWQELINRENNKMKKFEDLDFKAHPNWDGVQALMNFDNGFGVSVIMSEYSYGGKHRLYELAVMDKDGICYDSGITDDVIGELHNLEVTELMKKVQNL
jgi:hypothetical protein